MTPTTGRPTPSSSASKTSPPFLSSVETTSSSTEVCVYPGSTSPSPLPSSTLPRSGALGSTTAAFGRRHYVMTGWWTNRTSQYCGTTVQASQPSPALWRRKATLVSPRDSISRGRTHLVLPHGSWATHSLHMPLIYSPVPIRRGCLVLGLPYTVSDDNCRHTTLSLCIYRG